MLEAPVDLDVTILSDQEQLGARPAGGSLQHRGAVLEGRRSKALREGPCQNLPLEGGIFIAVSAQLGHSDESDDHRRRHPHAEDDAGSKRQERKAGATAGHVGTVQTGVC